MNIRLTFVIATLAWALSGCSTLSERGTLAELKGVKIELKDATVTDGLEKAMQSYRRFLEQTPESAMTPEALRRIADLSIEKEYGYVADSGGSASGASAKKSAPVLAQPEASAAPLSGDAPLRDSTDKEKIASIGAESDKDFEKRVAQGEEQPKQGAGNFAAAVPEGGDELANANAEQAIRLYKKLLQKYPLYKRNDQVLYQMSRAYEELGKTEEAMDVMNKFVKTYPTSRYLDEIQFRRAEYFFTRKKYLDSEEAYQSIVSIGAGSTYYELALYKLGWSFYKQEMYEDALHKYFTLLDYKVKIGYDFDQQHDQTESKRVEDTYRVVSLSFSNMGGPQAVSDYFARFGGRAYEDKVYSHLGEFYLTKRRYSDAAESYKTFVKLYPYHEVSPHFNMRVIDIYKKGGFGRLVVEAKKEFAQTYALSSEYWQYFDVKERPEVIGYLKANLKDLANHYHALYQDKRFVKEKTANYHEALVWYRNYLSSFPKEVESPGINYQMADLMLEHKAYGDAAIAYENTAYNYPAHEKSSAAGYAAVFAHREHLKVVEQGQRALVKQQIIKSSLKFADTFPKHEKVTAVLGAAADDLYEMKNYELAVKTARKLIDNYPNAEKELRRSAWMVVAHGSFELTLYADAEKGYLNVLGLTPAEDKSRVKLLDNLAASIYKQGEQANTLQDYKTAADHFLRVGKFAPNSTIRPTAEYDGAAALIQLQDWARAASVLRDFRKSFPNHELQPEVTKKIAFVYKSDGKLELAAAEYERIAAEATQEEVRRGALIIAAELYHEVGAKKKELAVYTRYVGFFPKPLEQAMEIYHKMTAVYQDLGDNSNYLLTLKKMVDADKTAGEERTDRTTFLAAQAALVLSKPLYDNFINVKLVKPLKQNLLEKKKRMKIAVNGYTKLIDYEVADVTAAATFYMAEIYYHFSRSLMESERPDNLNDLEMEQYELMLEEQAYPFEEKAIDVHKKNVELLYIGIYSNWIDQSIGKLAKIFPAVYARTEANTGFVASIDSFHYVAKKPAPAVAPAAAGKPGQTAKPASPAPQEAGPTVEVPTAEAEPPAAAETPTSEAETPAAKAETPTAEAETPAAEAEAPAAEAEAPAAEAPAAEAPAAEAPAAETEASAASDSSDETATEEQPAQEVDDANQS